MSLILGRLVKGFWLMGRENGGREDEKSCQGVLVDVVEVPDVERA
jgi:hypothetical protein